MARRLLRAIRGQVLHLDYPRRAAARLAPFDDAAPNHAQRRHNAHTYALFYSFKGQLSPRDPLAVAVDGNAMVTAERARLLPATPRLATNYREAVSSFGASRPSDRSLADRGHPISL